MAFYCRECGDDNPDREGIRFLKLDGEPALCQKCFAEKLLDPETHGLIRYAD